MKVEKTPDLPLVEGVQIRHVPGVEGYAVGDDGSVWGCRRPSRNRASEFRSWRRLCPSKNKTTGYWVVTLVASGKRRQFRVHCLVLESFVGPREGLKGLHWDDNKDNNRLQNLRWGTTKDNVSDCIRNGNRRCVRQGQRHHNARLSDETVREIRAARLTGATYESIGRQFSISMTLAWKIINGKNWTHVK